MITEPATTITDYVLGGVSLAWGRIVWRRAHVDEVSAAWWWATGFFAAALAAFAGGTVHGFRGPLDPGWEAALWKASLYAVGGFAFAAAMTAIAGGSSRRWRPLLTSIALVALVGYVVWVAGHPEFRYASAISAIGLLWLLAQQTIGWIRNKIPSAPWIAGGVAAAAVGAVIQQAGLAPHPRFNHNDVFHVIQIGSSYLFYRGGLLLTNRDSVRVA